MARFHYDLIQYSPEWWEQRRGMPSASDFDKVLQPVKMKPSGSQDAYMNQLVADTAELNPNAFTERGRMGTADMIAGRNAEPEARKWYQMYADLDVKQLGGVETDDGRFWCSPDGEVGGGAGLELKCPKLSTQVEYLRDHDALLYAYRCQVHGQLLVTGWPWVDLVSYAPGLPPVVLRIEPDDFTLRLAEELESFWTRYAFLRAQLLPAHPAVLREAERVKQAAGRKAVEGELSNV